MQQPGEEAQGRSLSLNLDGSGVLSLESRKSHPLLYPGNQTRDLNLPQGLVRVTETPEGAALYGRFKMCLGHR